MGIIRANANCDWSKRAHLPALLGMPDFELTAVCASRPETVEESRAFYGANPAFHDCTEMSNDPDVDLVWSRGSQPSGPKLEEGSVYRQDRSTPAAMRVCHTPS